MSVLALKRPSAAPGEGLLAEVLRAKMRADPSAAQPQYARSYRWARPPSIPRRIYYGMSAAGGRAIDLGCGVGLLTIYLAQHGWQVTGVDVVERALRTARRSADKSGVNVAFVRGDVTRLDRLGISGPFELLLDCGCFHNMSNDERRRYVESITSVAMANAQLMLFVLGPGRRPIWPRGAQRADVERHFSPGWTIVWSAPHDRNPDGIPPDKSATWYRLKRNESPPR
jgi:SAM-dependent methyltransferase